MNEPELYATTPEEALERYLSDRENEVSTATLEAHRYRLQHFVRWCKENEISDLNTLSGRDLQDYRYWRKQDGDLNNVTLHTQMTTFRVFLKWCQDFNAVTPGLFEKVRVPKMERNEDVADREMEPEVALKILDKLEEYHYASRKHAMFRVLFRTGVRTGGLRTINLGDYHSDEQYIEIHHRPERDTPLKNKAGGERPVYINTKTCQVLDDYITENRVDVKTSRGNSPMFTTSHGRMSRKTIRNKVYQMSQPCFYESNCPHDKKPETCKFTGVDHASKCPSTEPPHSVRKASITYWRSRDTPAQQVSERCDVGMDIIEDHYDKRADLDKMEQRKDFFDRE
jgi:site-specific recombinase XerD